MRWTRPIAGAAFVIIALLMVRRELASVSLTAKVDELQRERTELVHYAQRLTATSRVAQVDVLSQDTGEQGTPVTRLRWQEIGHDGVVGEPIEVETLGALVYFEAMVIKFEHRHIGEGDPVRGSSLATFRRIFGDRQIPDSAPPLAHALPATITSDGPDSADAKLWTQFWDLVEQPQLGKQFGVRVAQCEAAAVPLRTGQTWEIALDAAGGLNARKIFEPRGTDPDHAYIAGHSP